jgi:hypothetical protein
MEIFFLNVKDRLRANGIIFSVLLFVPVFFSLVMMSIVWELGQEKYFHPDLPFAEQALEAPHNAIFLSLYKEKNESFMIVKDTPPFLWNTKDNSAQKKLKDVLHKIVSNIYISAGLSHSFSYEQAFVVIGVDEKESFDQVAPIINVLAQLGITHYGFQVNKI